MTHALHRTAVRGRPLIAVLGTILVLLCAVNVLQRYGPTHTGLFVGPAAAVLLVVLVRRAGLTWDDLGLARRSWARGAAWAVGGVAVVAIGYAALVAYPVTRVLFLDVRHRLPVGAALLTALVVVPLSTVLLEEVAFRGVLLGVIKRGLRGRGAWWAYGSSSALFGAWHVLPALQLGAANRAVVQLVGDGTAARVLVVAAVVTFTAVAGLLLGDLRRRSGSLLASAGLHWATNGLGVLAAAVLWSAG